VLRSLISITSSLVDVSLLRSLASLHSSVVKPARLARRELREVIKLIRDLLTRCALQVRLTTDKL